MGNSASSDAVMGKHSSALDVVNKYGGEGSLKGKTCVVTGGNAGIGLETCKAMAFAGASVIMCSRSKKKAEDAIESEIKVPGQGGYTVNASLITVMELDLMSLASIKSFADKLQKKYKTIDYVVLNAGIMACPFGTTKDGFEQQIGVNYFGHYYLTSLLWDRLKKQKTPVRIVELSSLAHKFGAIETSDLHFSKGRSYSPWGAYGQSKLANIMHIKSLSKLASSEAPHITCYAVHPGVIYTNLTGNLGYIASVFYKYLASDKNIVQGASTTLYGCLSTDLNKENSGSYLSDCMITPSTSSSMEDEVIDELHRVAKEEIDAALKLIS